MTDYPNAKINLGLNVLRKREDGFHDLETVFYPVSLTDVLEILESPKSLNKIEPHLTGIKIPGDIRENLVYRIIQDIQEEFKLPNIEFFLHKRIPLGAGLGGGSSDAATALTMINKIFSLGLSPDEMEVCIAKYGADCSFFIRNTPALAHGIGNELSPVNITLKGKILLLVKPQTFVSTKEAYACIKPQIPNKPLMEILYQDLKYWKSELHNDFEDTIFKTHPEISSIKETLYDMGATYASMSGSGSALFGIFEEGILKTSGFKDGLDATKIFTDCFVHTSRLMRF